MKVENVYKLLKTIEGKDEYIQRNVRRILRYIYHDVYGPVESILDNAKIEHNKGSINYNNAVRGPLNFKKDLPLFADGDESIVTYLIEMVSDDKREYIDLFFGQIDAVLTIIENKYYEIDDFSPLNYVFNLYCMMYAYHCHKEDMDLYKQFLNDCTFFIKAEFLETSFYSDFNLKEKKKFIDALLSAKSYKEVERVRKFLKDILSRIDKNSTYSSEDLSKKLRVVQAIEFIYADYVNLKNENSQYDLTDYNVIIDDINKYLSGNYSDYVYYNKILLLGERYSFIKKNLSKYVGNDKLAGETFKIISSLDYHMFEYMNNTERFKDKDSFIECMNVIFDSDTYYELDSKLDALKVASNCFVAGEFEKVDKLYDDLFNMRHKLVVDGKYMAYGAKTMNKVDKPLSISKRMIELYSMRYPNVDINSIFKAIFKSNNCYLYSFSDLVNNKVKNEVDALIKLEQEGKAAEEKEREVIEKSKDEEVKMTSSGEEYESSNIVEVDSSLLVDSENKIGGNSESNSFFKIKSIFGRKW